VAKREWSTERVDEEWWGERVEALTPELAARLAKLRHFISPEKMIASVSSGLAYDEPGRRWVLPCRDIKGDIRFAKAWRLPPPNIQASKWVTVGHGLLRSETGAIGRMWDTPWLVDHLDKYDGGILWICAGEWDVIMLRCAGRAATCWTGGETSAIKVSQIVDEFGGEELTKSILGTFEKIAIVYDCDGAGRRGSKLWFNVLTSLVKKLGIETSVVAVDLRKAPGFYETGQLEGWDVSDFITWSRVHKSDKGVSKRLGPYWLEDCVSGTVEGLFDMEHVELSDVLRPAEGGGAHNFRTKDIPQLVEDGIQYANFKGGVRGEGAFHMGYKASRSGWDYTSLIEAGGAEAFKAAVDLEFPHKGDYPISEIIGHLKRSLMDYRSPEVLNTDKANMFRFRHYFPFLMRHPVRGWMWWSGTYWEDAGNRVGDHAMRVSDKILEESNEQSALGNDVIAAKLAKWAVRSQNRPQINNIVGMAESSTLFEPNREMDGKWDDKPMMLATPEGVVDLENPFDDAGNLVVIKGLEARNLFLSQTTRGRLSTRNHESVMSARAFVERVMHQWHADQEVLNTLQELAGWNLVGRNPQKLVVFQSPGRSGKTAFLNAISHALGPLSSEIGASTLSSNASDNSRMSAVAGFAGKRMAVIKEVGETGLDVETLKDLTGEQKIIGRKLYNNPSSFDNELTLYCTTNVDFVETLKKSSALGEAMRGRIIVIPWLVTFVDPEQLEMAYKIEKGQLTGNEMPRDRAIGLVLDHKAGKVFPLDRSLGFSMFSGLVERHSSAGERAVAAQAMADAWLQWAFDGWLRCLNRGGSYDFSLASSITRDTESSFDVADDIDYYFYQSGLWTPDPAGTLVTGPGLKKSIIDFLSEAEEVSLTSPGVSGGDSNFRPPPGSANGASVLERLRASDAALGKMLQGKRGFVNEGRQVSSSGMLWPTGARQDRCWKVPFRFVGGI